MKPTNTDIFFKCGVKYDGDLEEHRNIAEQYFELNDRINFLIHKLTGYGVSYGYVTHPETYKKNENSLKNMRVNNPAASQLLEDYEKAIQEEKDLEEKVKNEKLKVPIIKKAFE